MAKFWVLVLLFVLFLPLVLAQVLDSDNDNVSDTQEALDGTDPNNAADNLLEIRVDGALVVGNTIAVSLMHPLLGNVKDVEFVFSFGESSIPMNSGPSGIVSFKITSAGRHLVEAQKGAFSRSYEFYPECSVQTPVITSLSSAIGLLALFIMLVVAVLSFAGFRRLLLATESDYPLKKHATIIPAYVGVSAFLVAFSLYNSFGQLFGMAVLFCFLCLLLFSIWLLRETGIMKPVREKSLKKAKRAMKSLAFPALLASVFFERIGRKKEKPAAAEGGFAEIMELKEGISESLGRFEDAKKKTAEAKEPMARQEAMDELTNEISSLNHYLKRLLGFKEKKPEPVKTERQKTLADLREEKRTQIMVEDLLDQMAKELDLKELPDFAPVAAGEKKKAAKGITGLLAAIFIGGKKEPSAENANIELSLSDEFGNPLPASGAEFFIGGKKTEPLLARENTAFFRLKEGEHQLFVRVLGFVDNFLEIEALKEKRSFKAGLLADFKLSVTDEKGESLREAFVNIVDENGKRVEDVLQNIIWRTPTPNNAPDGVAAIPLNPKKLTFESLRVKIVRANYSLKEIIIPASRISTQKALEKTVSLEKLQK
ncbi:MAG: thrombospondin type 3 repeat-containing protein [Candidatus Diapherotrites archaeon]|nr:thrombospondin type 3 repeat-containing protein [Candidatus Diapherotrites archaeon]